MYKALCILCMVILSSSLEAKISRELSQQLSRASANEMVSCIVVMKTAYPFEEMTRATAKSKITAFKNIAWESQEPLMQWLSRKSGDVAECKRFWVLNGLYLKARADVIRELAEREDVGTVFNNDSVRIVDVPSGKTATASRGIAWGVRKILADKCWDEGYTGEGVIIGIVDTGVDYEHPALKGKWAGKWFVASGLPQTQTPYDDMKHGTHCMGSILGGDGYGSFESDIGVAPGAKFVAAKGLNSTGSGSSNQLIECLEFMADLKAEMDIKAVSNSWAGNGGQTMYLDICKTLRSLNIVPIFANGNNGSQGAGSAASPGDYPNVVGVGATDSVDAIGNFSSLGPAPDKTPYNDRSLWFRDDWNLIKPNISAPGVNVYSCVPDGKYETMNGTSMATPHLCGVTALLFQKNQNLTPEMVYNLLLDNADKPSGAGSLPNNTFGWGRVNAYKSLQATPTMNQPWIYLSKKQMGELKPGGTADLKITVKNLGGSDAFKTTGRLVSFDNYITVQNASYTYGDIKPKSEVSNDNNPYKITAHQLTPAGHAAVLGLIIHADAVPASLNYDDTVDISFVVGTAPAPYMIYSEDFEYTGGVDSFSINWSTTGNWSRVSDQSNSASHSASTGAHTSSNGMTLKNGINLSTYANPKLVFWSRDVCDWPENWKEINISASKDNGGSWKEIFTFTGTDRDNPSWSSREVPLNEYTVDNVKFQIAFSGIGGNLNGTFWIDDIQIQVPYDNEPPYFTNTTTWGETHLIGPFAVQSTVTDANGVKEAGLYYRTSSGSWNKLVMSPQGADVYKNTIPAQTGTGTIDYYLEAADGWALGANKGTDPVGAGQSGGYYSFIYGSTAVLEGQQAARFTLYSSVINGLVHINFCLPDEMKVTCSIIDMLGRKVAGIVNSNVKKGKHTLAWNKKETKNRVASGLYFLNFEANAVKGSGEARSYKKVERILLLK